MIRSFFIITLRILWRNKVTSFINIFSLAIGITAFILIMLYVDHETSYDKFNENYDRIYRLEGDEYAKLPPLIGEYISDKIPEAATEKLLELNLNYPQYGDYASLYNLPEFDKIKKEHPPFLEALNNLKLPMKLQLEELELL